MNLLIRNRSPFVLAMALLSASSFAELPGAGASKEEPSAKARVAFRVIGLMKTKSGAT